MSDGYPAAWPAIARAVKAAGGWRCVRCGHPHETPSRRADCDRHCRHKDDARQRVLTVHHLDGDKANCAAWNLAALCQVCHLFVQAVYLPGQSAGMFVLCEPWLAPYEAGRLAAEGMKG